MSRLNNRNSSGTFKRADRHTMACLLTTFPDEVLGSIVAALDPPSFAHLASTCHRMESLCRDAAIRETVRRKLRVCFVTFHVFRHGAWSQRADTLTIIPAGTTLYDFANILAQNGIAYIRPLPAFWRDLGFDE